MQRVPVQGWSESFPWWGPVAGVLVLACACGAGPAGLDADVNAADTGIGTDGPITGDDASPGCAQVPAPDPSWITSYQDDIVARLTGQAAIAPGVDPLSDRASVGRRNSARTYLLDKLDELGLDAQTHTYTTGGNPYAILPATTPTSRAFVIGAHFDSVPGSPGANDNATGVALVLGIARYLKDVDCRQANVYFVLFDEEEVGLVGSDRFATWLAAQPIDVVSVHTVDQMGWDEDGDRAIELERPSGALYAEWSASRTAAGMTMTLHQTSTGSTDHVSFRNAGFAAVGLTEEYVNGDTTPHYHAATDTYATVNFDYLRSTTILANAHFARLVRSPPSAQAHRPMWSGLPNHRGHAARPARALGCRHAYER